MKKEFTVDNAIHNKNGNVNNHTSVKKTTFKVGKIEKGIIIAILLGVISGASYYKDSIVNVFFSPTIASDFYSPDQQLSVVADVGKIRRGPNILSELIAYTKKGERIIFLGEKTEDTNDFTVNGKRILEHWVKVEYQNKVGWIFGGCVSNNISLRTSRSVNQIELGFADVKAIHPVQNFQSEISFQEIPLAIPFISRPLGGGGVRLREAPSLDAMILGMLYKENKFEVVAKTKSTTTVRLTTGSATNYWYKIVKLYKDNGPKMGWIHGSLIEFPENKSNTKFQQNTKSKKTPQQITNKRKTSQQKDIDLKLEEELDIRADIDPKFSYRNQSVNVNIYIDKNLGGMMKHLKVPNSKGVLGSVTFDLCIGNNGTIKLVELNREDTTVDSNTFIKSLYDEVKGMTFSSLNKDVPYSCGKLEVRISPKNMNPK